MSTETYTPEIPYLKTLGFREIRMYKHEHLGLAIPGDPRSLYYFPAYNTFRHACAHFYPQCNDDLETIVRCLSPKK